MKSVIEDLLDRLPEEYNMAEIVGKTTQRSPYVLVCFQECERMNLLLAEISRSLIELDLGLKVQSAVTRSVNKAAPWVRSCSSNLDLCVSGRTHHLVQHGDSAVSAVH